jgi:hypothetical protein
MEKKELAIAGYYHTVPCSAERTCSVFPWHILRYPQTFGLAHGFAFSLYRNQQLFECPGKS